MRESSLRVVVVADRPRTGRTLRAKLEGAGVDVCAKVNTSAAAVSAMLSERPDVCLVDAALADDALAAVAMITRRGGDAPVVMLGRDPSDQDMLDAIAAGASGFLPEDLPPARLKPALRDVSTGRSAFPRRLGALLVAALRDKAASGATQGAVPANDQQPLSGS
jgi:two-component system, NarL family, response regulator DevR